MTTFGKFYSIIGETLPEIDDQGISETQTDKVVGILEQFSFTSEQLQNVQKFIEIVAPKDDLAANLGLLNQTTVDTLIQDFGID